MNPISEVTSNLYSSSVAQTTKPTKASEETTQTDVKKSAVSGRTYGNPKLSDKAKAYYEELQKKFGDMDFVLVSKDKIEEAKSKLASFAGKNKLTVLIDEEKIEKMAVDEEYRKKYEGILTNAKANMNSFAEQVKASGAEVKGYGIQINDNGTASYFAVIDKSYEAQKERIEKKVEEKKEAKKEADKEAKAEAQKEHIEAAREDRAEAANEAHEKVNKFEDLATVSANSIEELLNKINDIYMASRSDSVRTDAEMQVGQHIDFSL